jgi:hypothetical protein
MLSWRFITEFLGPSEQAAKNTHGRQAGIDIEAECPRMFRTRQPGAGNVMNDFVNPSTDHGAFIVIEGQPWGSAGFYGEWLLAAAAAENFWKEIQKETNFYQKFEPVCIVYMPDFGTAASIVTKELFEWPAWPTPRKWRARRVAVQQRNLPHNAQPHAICRPLLRRLNSDHARRLLAGDRSSARHVELVGDATFRQAHELGERRIWPTRSAGQRGNEARHRRVGVPVERAEIDRLRRAARWAPHPKEPIARGRGGADRRREQHRHVPFLAGVPSRDQALGVLDDLPSERAPGLRRLRRGGGSFALHAALVKAHGRPQILREGGFVACSASDDTGWVCEDHGDRTLKSDSDRADACACGAGMPCPSRNTEELPRPPLGMRVVVDGQGPRH